MFSSKLKRPALALAVTAGLLAVAGPASAQIGPASMGVTTPHPGSKAPANATSVWHEAARTGLKYETEVTDYVRLSTASDGHQGSPVDNLLNDIESLPARSDSQGSPVDNLLNDIESLPARSDILMETMVTSAGADSTPKARSAVLPELDANANTSLPEVDDEVLAWVVYTHPEVA